MYLDKYVNRLTDQIDLDEMRNNREEQLNK
jgi:hypothetical protein